LRHVNWSARGAVIVLPAVAAFVVLIDQLSKYLVTAWLDEGRSWDIVSWLAPVFRITHVTNTGVAFGMFPGAGRVFAVVHAVVAMAILIYGWRLPDDQWLMRVVLGLPLGGAIGNLIDRVRQGFVIDFIDFNFWPMRDWPVCNLADSAIVAGVGLLALLMLWEERCAGDEQRAIKDSPGGN
jgi:signal peptidase II